ncbi:hypothetical protein ACCO45_009878 [Purpureocillium lilacinum]|uniref:Uncharacterized protein n=1 Tax=Purpureocillium lilacinum TaxID=33203 RepID=A0ACC4DJW2_PURLI
MKEVMPLRVRQILHYIPRTAMEGVPFARPPMIAEKPDHSAFSPTTVYDLKFDDNSRRPRRMGNNSEQTLMNFTSQNYIERLYTTPATTPHTAQNSSLKALHMLQHSQPAGIPAHHRCIRRACASMTADSLCGAMSEHHP